MIACVCLSQACKVNKHANLHGGRPRGHPGESPLPEVVQCGWCRPNPVEPGHHRVHPPRAECIRLQRLIRHHVVHQANPGSLPSCAHATALSLGKVLSQEAAWSTPLTLNAPGCRGSRTTALCSKPIRDASPLGPNLLFCLIGNDTLVLDPSHTCMHNAVLP